MRKALGVVTALLWTSFASAQSSEPPEALRSAFQARIAARANAAAAADPAAYKRFIDPHLVFILDDGTRSTAEQHLAYIGGRPVGRSRYVVDDVTVKVEGELAVADYRSTEFVRYGDHEIPGPMRGLDVYTRHAGEWLLRAHAEAPLMTLPTPVTVDAGLLAQYAGRYEWWPGFVDSVAFTNGKLTEQGPDESAPTELRAATPTAFFFDGDPSVLVFERNASGAVSGYVIHFPTGQVVAARRLP